ncbi:MAG: spherulation-specific family 4 protein, partial [Acidobacteriota bacterium]|nr:spherulation-specific family 4 protein [Acidobacteriota bacterium]
AAARQVPPRHALDARAPRAGSHSPRPGGASPSVGPSAPAPAGPKGLTAGIPAYWYPDAASTAASAAVLAAPAEAVSFVIADVTTTGTGSSVDPAWLAAVRAYRHAGVAVFGYVDTSYGRVSLASAEANVQHWYSWYGVDGIFFDNASTDPTLAAPDAYYGRLYRYVKDMTGPGVLGTTVVLNPGTGTARPYMADADIVCDFEGTEASYAAATPPAWTAAYAPSRFWNIVYASAGVTPMRNDVALARARGVGNVFITTLAGANPYDAMPPGGLWEAEIAALNAP